MRASISVDLDLVREAFTVPLAWNSTSAVTLLVLLRVLQTDPTLDSVSCRLFSLLSVPNPKRLRKEDVLEVNEPVFVDLAREFIDPLMDDASPFELTGGVSAQQSINEEESFQPSRLTFKKPIGIVHKSIKQRDVFMGIAFANEQFSKSSCESTPISIIAGCIEQTANPLVVSRQPQSITNSASSLITAAKARRFCGAMSPSMILKYSSNEFGDKESTNISYGRNLPFPLKAN